MEALRACNAKPGAAQSASSPADLLLPFITQQPAHATIYVQERKRGEAGEREVQQAQARLDDAYRKAARLEGEAAELQAALAQKGDALAALQVDWCLWGCGWMRGCERGLGWGAQDECGWQVVRSAAACFLAPRCVSLPLLSCCCNVMSRRNRAVNIHQPLNLRHFTSRAG